MGRRPPCGLRDHPNNEVLGFAVRIPSVFPIGKKGGKLCEASVRQVPELSGMPSVGRSGDPAKGACRLPNLVRGEDKPLWDANILEKGHGVRSRVMLDARLPNVGPLLAEVFYLSYQIHGGLRELGELREPVGKGGGTIHLTLLEGEPSITGLPLLNGLESAAKSGEAFGKGVVIVGVGLESGEEDRERLLNPASA